MQRCRILRLASPNDPAILDLSQLGDPASKRSKSKKWIKAVELDMCQHAGGVDRGFGHAALPGSLPIFEPLRSQRILSLTHQFPLTRSRTRSRQNSAGRHLSLYDLSSGVCCRR